MKWQEQLNGDSLSWLLEDGEPGVRYLAMRDLLELPADDVELIAAQELAHNEGPISIILDEMDDSGYWVKAGSGYLPKYRSTVWSIIMLAQLGASVDSDGRIQQACRYLFEHALTANGQFTSTGTPSGTVDCLQGNLCAAMLDLGFSDPRLEKAFEWMARSVTGEGVAPMKEKKAPLRYYSGKYGPGFLCGANNKLPCAWGAVKVMLAFGKLPQKHRTPLIENAIEKGIDFLLGIDPAEATYPTGWSKKPSGNWWKFGFPVFYVTDLLQNVEALVRLGYGNDPRLSNVLKIIREKQDGNGRWALEYDYSGKTWCTFGKKKEANKWVTFRALWALKHTKAKQIMEY
ncbi:MAG: nitrogen fixation protein NifH [Chloroflexi bacterium]|nr:nitrogen fixation protein NifH [Chloroflexota bacterium]